MFYKLLFLFIPMYFRVTVTYQLLITVYNNEVII